MNLNDFLPDGLKPVATKNLLKDSGVVTLLSIKKDSILKEHQSKTNAMLVLLSGQATYEEENRKIGLKKIHDFVLIPEKVSHKVLAEEDAVLLLIQ